MKNFKVSNIVANSAAPGDKDTFDHINNIARELGESLGKAFIDGYAIDTLYALEGCVVTKDGDDYAITAGSLFYNGEIYALAATDFTSANEGKFYIRTSAVSKVFKDNTTKAWLETRSIEFIPDDASGDEVAAWDNVVYMLLEDSVEQTNEAANNICDNIIITSGASIDQLRMRAFKRNGIITISGDFTVNVDSAGSAITTPNSIQVTMPLKPKYRPKENDTLQWGVATNFRRLSDGSLVNQFTLPVFVMETISLVFILNNLGWGSTIVIGEKIRCTFSINFI